LKIKGPMLLLVLHLLIYLYHLFQYPYPNILKFKKTVKYALKYAQIAYFKAYFTKGATRILYNVDHNGG
jgi:hypothetical protein